LLVGLGVVLASCFPFVYQSMLPLLTYSGLLLVPIGGIVFAEHYVFGWIGYTRYWYRYKGLTHNVPAIATWAISLVFGFGLNVINIMPYYYLFLPTWFVSVILYVVLGKMYGAAEKYPEEEEAERRFQERVAEYQAKQAARESHPHVKDTSLLTKIIKAVWIVIGIIVPLVLAWITLFHSADLYDYYVNVKRFYSITIWCTVIYFIFAYWDLRRSKAHHQAQAPAVAQVAE
jgi:cytosine permease